MAVSPSFTDRFRQHWCQFSKSVFSAQQSECRSLEWYAKIKTSWLWAQKGREEILLNSIRSWQVGKELRKNFLQILSVISIFGTTRGSANSWHRQWNEGIYPEVTEGVNPQTPGAQDAGGPVPLPLHRCDRSHCRFGKTSLRLTPCHHAETQELQVSSPHPMPTVLWGCGL